MTLPPISSAVGQPLERVYFSDLLHAMSQPVTALECGLELALRKDTTAMQLRARLKTALVTARLLHQRLVEFQVLQNAGEPGDTSRPAAVEIILLQLREDFVPVARSAKVKLAVKCESAMVHGDEARLRNGFFHLFEFLLRMCSSHGNIRICAHTLSPSALQVNFSSDASTSIATPEQPLAVDLDLRIARRTFQAAGGDLFLATLQPGKVAGCVRLLLAN